MDKAERIALFQKWFSDTIPHNKALGLKVIGAGRGFASMQLDWREELVGNPETGVLAGGPLTAMLDGCCGMSVATMLKAPEPFATLDLRIDYLRAATPGRRLTARADCVRVTRSIAFVRAHAFDTDPQDPIATAQAAFVLKRGES